MSARHTAVVIAAVFGLLVWASAALTGTVASELSWSLSRDGAAVSAPTGSRPAGTGPVGTSPAGTSASGERPGGTYQAAAVVDEPMEWRLLRTLQIGAPQGVSADEMLAFAHGNEADYTGHVLARAALTAIGEDRDFPDWPLARLLERTLTQLQRGPSSAYNLPAVMPDGFRGEHLVASLVYALVVSGQQDQAIDVLEAQLGSGSSFKRGVILQALRTIGTDRATGIVQQAADETSDSLPTNLLADHYYPFLHELYDNWELVPPAERGRESLTALAGADCGRPASVAVYLLGFFAPAADPAQERAELDVLRRVTRLERRCFYNRFFAIRSLALRSSETIDFWVELYGNEQDAWQRAQLVRIGFARFGREFLDTALELLATEPQQYVQWELMHGNIEVREGAKWRDYWDIWLTPTLQFRLDFPEDSGAMPDADRDALFAWLETGAYPQNPWVRNHMLYGMARHVDADSTRRFLRIFDALPEKAANWWILGPLSDPAALPLLRYWATLETSEQQRGELAGNIRGMESRLANSSGPSGGTGGSAGAISCCAPTRACLLAAIDSGGFEPAPLPVIETEEQARAWLDDETIEVAPRPAAQISFLDELERIAVVTWPVQDRSERWEHLFGCWRRVDGS